MVGHKRRGVCADELNRRGERVQSLGLPQRCNHPRYLVLVQEGIMEQPQLAHLVPG